MNRTAAIDAARAVQKIASQMHLAEAGGESDALPMSFGDLPPLSSPEQLTATPQEDGGIVVFEPVAGADVAASDADFAAGCGYYLNFTVGGQPALGQTPLTFSITRNKREQFALPSLRLSAADAVAFAKAVGATETAVGTIDRAAPWSPGGELALTYRLIDANTAQPRGEPIVVRGTPTAILLALPDVARRLACQAGVAHPLPMVSPAATPALLAAEVRTHRNEHPTPGDAAQVISAAPRDPIALLYVLEYGRGKSTADFAANARLLLTKLAPDNARAWGDVAYISAATLIPLRSELAARRKAYPNNYGFAQTDAWLTHASGSPRAELLASEDAVRAAPNNPDAWNSLGRVLGSIGQALRRDRTADAITPAEWNTLAALYACHEDYERRAVTLDPRHRSAWIYLSVAAMYAGDRATVEDAYHKAVYYGPGKDIVYGWGLQIFRDKWGGSPAELNEVAKAAASENYSTVEQTGNMIGYLKDAGFPAKAKALGDCALLPLDAQIKIKPDDVNAHWNRASLLWYENDMPAACREYAFVAQRLPNNVRAQICYADALDKEEQLPEAVVVLRKALRQDPQNKGISPRLGRELRQLGRFAEAEKWLRVGLQQYPNSAYCHGELAQLYEETGQDVASAEEYRRAIALGDHSVVIYANFAWLLDHMNQYADTIHWSEEGIGLFQNGEEKLTGIDREDISMLHAALALAYLKTHRDSDAETQNAVALALNPRNPPALIDQGYIYNDQHQRSKARWQWQAVTKMKLNSSILKEARHDLAIYPENGT